MHQSVIRSSAMNKPVVLITGALTGIGRAAAVAFAKKGAKVVVAGRHDEAGKALAKELRSFGSEAEFINADVRKEDGLARDREVILFNNAGVSSSSGEVPTTFERMGANAIAFIKALGLKQLDILGFSIGGMVAQEITLQAPDLVRRLIVDGTGPRGGQGMELIAHATGRLFGAHPHDPPESVWLAVKFSPSAAARRRDG